MASWHLPDVDRAESPVDPGLLVSLHFLLAALRRRWRIWVGLALVGVLLGMVWIAVVPPRSTGTVTLFLSHDPNVEPAMAMATDVSLLRTRTVAATLIDKLDLTMTPEDFQDTVVTTAVTPQVLQIDLAGPDAGSARTRVATLADVFLDFRGKQLRAGSDAIVSGNRERVEQLEDQAAVLTEEFERLSTEGAAKQGEAAGVLTERSQLSEEIMRRQQSSEETTLQTEAILQASGVIDPADVVPRSRARHQLFTVGAALAGGLGIGVGYVLVTALTSSRLRRRDEVALALGIPVTASAEGRGRAALEPVIRSVVTLSTESGRQTRLAVAAAPGTKDHLKLVARAARALTEGGSSVCLVDLGRGGRLSKAVGAGRKLIHRPASPLPVLRPDVHRPPSRPSIRVAGLDSPVVSDDARRRSADEDADVVLVYTEIGPTTDLGPVTAWADELVIVVEAGRSTAEWLRSVAELVRTAGLPTPFAVMTRADRTDESSGMLPRERAGAPGMEHASDSSANGAGDDSARRSVR